MRRPPRPGATFVIRAASILLLVAGCSGDGGSPPSDAAVAGDRGLTCTPCASADGCGASGVCLRYGGDARCGVACATLADCAPDEDCESVDTIDGASANACVPRSGACPALPCGPCAAGTVCDLASATCKPLPDMAQSALCGTLAPPGVAACCTSCTPGVSGCQSNGCYGGWFCDTAGCACGRPPPDCGQDLGAPPDFSGQDGAPPVVGAVGNGGGTVSRLYFAVVGDTRPANPDDTAAYPTAIISRIYQDLQAENPRPSFVVTTGDYMFASITGMEGAAQIKLYQQATALWTGGPIFPVMGNHECTGATAGNCPGFTTNNLTAFSDALLKPIGKTLPYYTLDFAETNGAWTAKFLMVACNAWDPAQADWLSGELARATTYTFVVRHEPPNTDAPCVPSVDGMLANASYDLLIAGHSHSYYHFGKTLVVGNGGAPISGNTPFGYAIVDQQANGFVVTQRDYATGQPLSSFVVP
jgi:hypothetical protein